MNTIETPDNKKIFWAKVFSKRENKGEAFKLATKVFNQMKKNGETTAWSMSEMTNGEFAVAIRHLNYL